MAEITTAELKALLRECRAVIDDATDTMPDAEPLREALQKYGRHEETCPIVDEAGDSFCTCGFSAALGGGK